MPFELADLPQREGLGRALLEDILNFIRQQKKLWESMSEADQKLALDWMRESVRNLVQKAVGSIAQGEYPAVVAQLTGVHISNGIGCKLIIDRAAPNRHALMDFQGQTVILVLAEPDKYLRDMDQVKATAAQGDMFGEVSDPSDSDPLDDTPEFEGGEEGEINFDPLGDLAMRIARLQGGAMSVNTIKSWSPEQRSAAVQWLEAVERNPQTMHPRPFFIPEADSPAA